MKLKNVTDAVSEIYSSLVGDSSYAIKDVVTAVNDILVFIKGGGIEYSKKSFVAYSEDIVTIGSDQDSPSFLTGLVLGEHSDGFELAYDGIKNISGRKINTLTGTISFQPKKDVGGTTSLNIWSERSSDGVTWIQNQGSLRTIEISNSGETFKTSISAIKDFMEGETVRFRAYAKVGGSIDFIPPSDIVLGGETISGYSVFWELLEI